VGLNSHLDLCNWWTKVHRIFFWERRKNRTGNISFLILDILSRSWDIRDQSRMLCKMDRNFACFWPQIFWGRAPPPEFWKLDYKIGPVSNHVATFHGDRPSELGDYALEKKKHHEHFIRPPVTTVHGRPRPKYCFISVSKTVGRPGRLDCGGVVTVGSSA